MLKRNLLGAVVTLMLCACGAEPAKQGVGGEVIQVDGSSTVFPISEAAAEQFAASQSGAARVAVGESGTGGGFRKFCRGETQVQGASRPILAEEMQACAAAGVMYVEAPIAFDGLTVVVHPSNTLANISMAELRRTWEPAAQGQVTNWRQINPRWPDLGLQLFGAGTASGTFDYFIEAVVGVAKSSRTDYTPTEDDNVTVTGVAGNPGAMGYFGYAYYDQNRARVKALSVEGVSPSPERIADGSYPLSRPLFVYFNAEMLRRPQVQRFAQYLFANAAQIAPSVGYVALPERAYATYSERVRVRQAGTAFGGRQDIGASIEDVLARPLRATGGE
ncbi:MAG: PstS family phosphate ABC transporter substrate-binding protein [Terricaulis sp.]